MLGLCWCSSSPGSVPPTPPLGISFSHVLCLNTLLHCASVGVERALQPPNTALSASSGHLETRFLCDFCSDVTISESSLNTLFKVMLPITLILSTCPAGTCFIFHCSRIYYHLKQVLFFLFIVCLPPLERKFLHRGSHLGLIAPSQDSAGSWLLATPQ